MTRVLRSFCTFIMGLFEKKRGRKKPGETGELKAKVRLFSNPRWEMIRYLILESFTLRGICFEGKYCTYRLDIGISW